MTNIFPAIFRSVQPSLRQVIGLFVILLVFSSFVFASENYSAQSEIDVKRTLRSADKLILHGEYEEAEKLLKAALVEHPQDASLKLKLAFTLAKLKAFMDAYNLSYAVAKDEPKNAHAFAVLGSVLLTGGRFNDARMILTRGYQLDKDDGLVLASVGLLEFYENRLMSSLDYLSRAVFREPENPDYIFAYAQVAARAERYQEAADHYRKFLLFSKNTDDDRRARIRGLIKFLEYLGFRSSLYTVSGAERSVVDLELKGNRPIVSLKINGRPEPLRFVLDTGSGISVISLETAKRLKMKPIAHGGHAKGIGGDGRFEIVYGFLRDVQIGNTKIRNVPVYIRQFHHNIHNIDGYIGISLISKFLTTVDYPAQTFTLTRLAPETTAGVNQQGISLPLRLTSSGFLSGEVQMDGVAAPMNFIVDTGASVSVVSNTVAKREPLLSLPRRDPLRVVGSAGVTENVESFTLPRISFGEHTRESITAIALNLDIINDASGFEQSGILGGNFFLNYRLTFDFRNSSVLFTPVKAEPSAAPPEQNEIKSLP